MTGASTLCYYLVSEYGCDPEMQDRLGLKIGQIRGIVGDTEEGADAALGAEAARGPSRPHHREAAARKGGGMTIQTLSWAIAQTAGGPSAKATLWAIANYANDQWCAWPSQKTIMADSEQSADSVQRRIPELVAQGLMRRVPLRFAGRRTVDFYILAPSPWFDKSLAEIEVVLPRGCIVDPKFFAPDAAADCGSDEKDTDAGSADVAPDIADRTLPQTGPQSAADAAALVRQQEPFYEPKEPRETRARVRAKPEITPEASEAESAPWSPPIRTQRRTNSARRAPPISRSRRRSGRRRATPCPAGGNSCGPQKRRPPIAEYLLERKWELVAGEGGRSRHAEGGPAGAEPGLVVRPLRGGHAPWRSAEGAGFGSGARHPPPDIGGHAICGAVADDGGRGRGGGAARRGLRSGRGRQPGVQRLAGLVQPRRRADPDPR